MAYTPPAGDAVDFTLTGDAYTPPVGDAVDFSWDTGVTASIVFPFALAASANHQAAFTADGQLPFVIAASANHQVAFVAGEFVPVVVGDARQQIASVATALPFSISASAVLFPAGSQLATSTGPIKFVLSGVAQAVYAPVVSAIFPFVGSSRANYVYNPSASVVCPMSGTAFAFRPGYAAFAVNEFPVIIGAQANPGRVASAAMVFQMTISGRTVRRFRASANNKLYLNIDGIAA